MIMYRAPHQKGISMIEVIIAMGVVSILIVIIASSFRLFNERQHVTSTVAEIVALMRDAREQTLGAVENDQYGIHIESDRATLFKGNAFVEGEPKNKELVFDTRVEIFDINAPESNVIFKRLTGEIDTPSSLSVHLKDDITASSTIIIIKSGIIYVE